MTCPICKKSCSTTYIQDSWNRGSQTVVAVHQGKKPGKICNGSGMKPKNG